MLVFRENYNCMIEVLFSIASDTVCPDGWLGYAGVCYLFQPYAKSHHMAEALCQTYPDTRLVTLSSKEEEAFISQTINDFNFMNESTGYLYMHVSL